MIFFMFTASLLSQLIPLKTNTVFVMNWGPDFEAKSMLIFICKVSNFPMYSRCRIQKGFKDLLKIPQLMV